MSRRLANHVCVDKKVYRTRAEAEQEIARWRAMGRLDYEVCVYVCPISQQDYHIGRARRAMRG